MSQKDEGKDRKQLEKESFYLVQKKVINEPQHLDGISHPSPTNRLGNVNLCFQLTDGSVHQITQMKRCRCEYQSKKSI